MKKLPIILLFLLFPLILPFHMAMAVTDPLATPNNKYGIHIIDESDLENAAALVNSSGGDWGYVTVVIREDQRNVEQWNNTFSKMRDLHLIPLVRIATKLHSDGSWNPGNEIDAQGWADFLDQLQWVTKNRYVIIFNEPNHAKEWGNTVAPEAYARVLVSYAQALKDKSEDFFVLPAGLDASAPNSWSTMDEAVYIRRMIQARPEVFLVIDGWTSHSYPNPGFVGEVEDEGRGTVRTYQWELHLLQTLGMTKSLPVFITETGWPHEEGTELTKAFASADDVADRITQVAEDVWSDPQIVAITPFVLNYPAFPFSNFSWQIPGLSKFYPQYDSYRSLPKIAGQPSVVALPTAAPTTAPTTVPNRFLRTGEDSTPPVNKAQSMIHRIITFFRVTFPVFAAPASENN